MLHFNKMYLSRNILNPESYDKYAILSTAANPLHIGHISILDEACSKLNYKPVIELSANNADKGRISDEVIEERITPIINLGYRYIVSDIQSYIGKANQYSEVSRDFNYKFVIGSDTFERILNPEQFIFGDYNKLHHYMNRLLNNKFIIFNRPNYKTTSQIWADFCSNVDTPVAYDELFSDKISLDYYKNIVLDSTMSISSTEIRNKNAKNNSEQNIESKTYRFPSNWYQYPDR